MIKINLLPVRQFKKRASARNQIVLVVFFFCCFCAVLAALTFVQLQKVKNIETAISKLENEKQDYDKVLAKIRKIEKTREELERKSAVIDQLKSDSSLTVRVLDEVANIIDNERMWLLSLNQQGGVLQLQGVALDNQTVAQFMDNLELSEFVNNVDLTDSTLKKVSGRDLKSFTLSCAVSQPQKETQEVAKAGQ